MKQVHDISRTSALDRLLELVVVLGDDMTQSLAAEGLTVPRAHLLWLLHHGGATTQRSLADALNVSPRNVTGLVDGLVATGFVTRESHPTDRRATLVSLTRRAAETLAAMDAGHQQLAELLFEGMSDRRLGALAGELEQIAARVRGRLAAGAAR